MSWIPMRHDLAEDPAVIGIASTLGIDEDHVVGKLHKVWSWFDRQTKDGTAPGVSAAWIDKLVRTNGFAQSMTHEGWLIERDGLLIMPKFDQWISDSAKNRLQAARRKRREREKLKSVTNPSRRERDKFKHGEEKSREDCKSSPTSLSSESGSSDSLGGNHGPDIYASITLETLRNRDKLREFFLWQASLPVEAAVTNSGDDAWSWCCHSAVQSLSGRKPVEWFKILFCPPGQRRGKKKLKPEFAMAARQFAKGAA